MGTSTGLLWDPFARRPGEQMMARSGVWDVGHTYFSNSTHKRIKLTLTGYSRLYSDL